MTSHDLPSDDGPRADRPKRRTFSAAYKLRVVEDYDAAPSGEKGALLRREGLYESSISLWRRQRDAGQLTASGTDRPTTKKEKSPEQAELEQLRKEKARLERQNAAMARKVKQTEVALDIMGKGFALLETMSESADTENS
ncbi:transposase [Actinomadura sp. WMMB 499]|uniref:transposase n=1 Tax=Actinomadura sp. WMMB 499 TaxID=1219491 RepID=UPI001C3FAE8C|nr:transposase [Actinomadura sp. WMMB 499]